MAESTRLRHLKSLWGPATALMHLWTFPVKMAVIGAAFCVPLVWMLWSYSHDRVEALKVTDAERMGVAYAQAVLPALQASETWRLQLRRQALQDGPAQVEEARKAFDAAWSRVADLQKQRGPSMGTASAWTAAEKRVEAARGLSANDPQVVYSEMTALSRAITALLAASVDGSGLALDPELHSYYVMSMALMRSPMVMVETGELRGLGADAIRTGRFEPASLAAFSGRLEVLRHEWQLAQGDAAKVQASGGIPAGLQLSTAAFAPTGELINALAALARNPEAVTGDRPALIEQATQALTTQHRQVLDNLRLLDAMLAQRGHSLLVSMWVSWAVAGLGVLLALWLTMGFFQAQSGGMRALREHLLVMSMGDLRNDIPFKGRDELAGLLKELGRMQAGLRDTVRLVRHSSNEVVNASIEIAEGTMDLSARTEAASAALEESSAALEQSNSTTAHTAASVEHAAQLAMQNAGVAERGGRVVGDVVATMERIQTSSSKINEIIGVIDSIAFQTNILALNAAVEAARAGEQGRGFAVVAAEVRALAQRSAEAAKQIKVLITSSVDEVNHGVVVVRGAGEAMQEMLSNADQVRVLMEEVSTAAREQSAGIAQIGEAVQSLDQNTQANAALVEEAAAAAKAQRDAAVRMAAMVDEFRLTPGRSTQASKVQGVDVDTYIDAHRQWKVKLRNAIENRETVDVSTLSRDDCCALGKWVYGDGKAQFGDRPSFTELIARHQDFHRVAGQVGELVNQKRYTEAEDALNAGSPFSDATRAVVLVLSAAKRLGF